MTRETNSYKTTLPARVTEDLVKSHLTAAFRMFVQLTFNVLHPVREGLVVQHH